MTGLETQIVLDVAEGYGRLLSHDQAVRIAVLYEQGLEDDRLAEECGLEIALAEAIIVALNQEVSVPICVGLD